MPLCVWLSVVRVRVGVCGGREGGERGASHSTALCQAPSAAPFYFALNGLSKDPLSRAAESFLHFKKKKKKRKVGISFGSIVKCVRRRSITRAYKW